MTCDVQMSLHSEQITKWTHTVDPIESTSDQLASWVCQLYDNKNIQLDKTIAVCHQQPQTTLTTTTTTTNQHPNQGGRGRGRGNRGRGNRGRGLRAKPFNPASIQFTPQPQFQQQLQQQQQQLQQQL